MSVSAELMKAILAMDAYNRGYNPGIALQGDQIGNATIVTDSTREFRDPNADPEAPTPDEAAGFYAVAYEWTNPETGLSETIISYRGTDSAGELLSADFPIAVNDDYDEAQIHLASQFYQAVAGGASDYSVTLTGHSLGGALAGFTGSLHNQNIVSVATIG